MNIMISEDELTLIKETSLDQCNKLKTWIDYHEKLFDKLDIIQFADYIIIKPKEDDLKQFWKYWKIHQKYEETKPTIQQERDAK